MSNPIFHLWNNVVPFARPEDAQLTEHFKDNPNHDGIDRLTDVTDPTITVYPASGKGPHPAVLVCPGGGYSILAWNHEGIDICSLLNINGFTAFLLKYRCPNRRDAAHADAARAMRFIRANAEKFEIDPARVGAIGFSAGANLCAYISAPANPVIYDPADELDQLEYRPNFTALIYPWDLTDMQLNLKPEFKVDSNTPSTLLIQAEDDSVHVENSLAWYWALKRAGVGAEMHLWEKGGHGYGLIRYPNPISNWGSVAGEWFRRQAGLC